jgi:sugar transferase (PEP-CTERM system associated)
MLSVLRHSFTPRILATLVVEVLALVLLSLALPFLGREETRSVFRELSLFMAGGLALFNTAAVQFSFWSFGLYSREAVYSGRTVLQRLALALGFSALLLVPSYAVLGLVDHPLASVPAHVYLLTFAAFAALTLLERLLLQRLLTEKPYFESMLVLGSGRATEELLREVRRQYGPSLHAAGILAVDPSEKGRSVGGVPVIGSLVEIRDHVDYCRADAVLVALPPRSADLPTDYLLRLKLAGVQVLDAAEFYESIGKKVLLELFDPLDLLWGRRLFMTRLRWKLKSLVEKSLALVILIAGLPAMLLAAILVRLTSPGPVLYRQTRCGRDGRPFTLLKFRSMVDRAEAGGAVWAAKHDPRVTRWGRVMRATRIDELPQLFNILRGDMSVVGPRPERPEFVAQLRESIPHYDQRHLVKPGLTGWAQVAFRYGASFEDSAEKLRYDLYYVKHMSLGFDLLIILNTVRIVLLKGGAR